MGFQKFQKVEKIEPLKKEQVDQTTEQKPKLASVKPQK